jgi:hypothetical protein
MRIFNSVFFYGLAGFAGWYGINYATTTQTKFPERPHMVIANIEPFAGDEEPVCYKDEDSVENSEHQEASLQPDLAQDN